MRLDRVAAAFTVALLAPSVLAIVSGCGSPSSSGGTGGATGSAGTTGSAGRAAGGTTGAGGAAGTTSSGTGGGTCSPLTATVGVSTISGPAVGAGLVANSAVKKTLQVTDLSHNSMFTITGAWLVDVTSRRSLGQDPFADTFVALTYHGSVPICSAQLSTFTYRDAAGNNINANLGISPTNEAAYVHSGTGMQCAGLKQGIGNCLAPGESAIAWDHVGFSGATLATTPVVAVDFASITGITTLADAQPDINVAVTGYTVDAAPDANSPQALHMTLKNTGTGSVMLGGLVVYFMLDEQGLPVYEGAATGTQVGGTLTAGQTVTVSDTNVGFDGSSTRIRFLPSFNRLIQ